MLEKYKATKNKIVFFLGLEFIMNQTGPAINPQTISNPYLFEEWFKYGKGPLTTPGGVDGLAYLRSPSGKEIELIFAPIGATPHSFFMATLLLEPDARGNITLKSKNPLHPPIMSYDYYESKTDLEDNVFALKYGIKLVEETQAFKDVGAILNPVPYSKCDHLLFKSDDYWACISKHMTNTYHHQCSTCRMGEVVNSELKVIGIDGLRVVDSSIFPNIPHAHLYSPTLMVGEKAADMIRSDWSQ